MKQTTQLTSLPLLKNCGQVDMNLCQLPVGKNKHEFSVQGVSGLRVTITSKSTTFMHRYTFDGKKGCSTLGKYPELLSEHAIQLVQNHNKIIDSGINPYAQLQKDKAMPTFANFATTVYLPTVSPHKKSVGDDESRIRMHLNPEIGHMRLNEITAPVLSMLLASKQQGGLSNATVNRIRALLSSIMNLAIEHELILLNPVSRVKKFKENNVIERYLSDDELSRLMKVLHSPMASGIDNLVIVAIIKFLLLTGVRKREAMDMKWQDVDIAKGQWLNKLNKSGKARHISLSADAMNVISKMPKDTEYVFANPKTGLPFNDIRKTFDKIMGCAGIDNMRIHDLRHNFASMAVNNGESLFVVQKLLGHASPQTTQCYAHLNQSTLLSANEKVASFVRDAHLTS